jgi:hypothetical protein
MNAQMTKSGFDSAQSNRSQYCSPKRNELSNVQLGMMMMKKDDEIN